MSKKLENNGLWESSRMMLPEHKEAILTHRQELKRMPRPLLDEQSVEQNARKLLEASQTGATVHIAVYDAFGRIEIAGFVRQMDMYMQRIKFIHGAQKTWIDFADILHVEIAASEV